MISGFFALLISLQANAGCFDYLLQPAGGKKPSQIAREEGLSVLAIQVDFTTLQVALALSKGKHFSKFYFNEPDKWLFEHHDMNHLIPMASKRGSQMMTNGTAAPIFVFDLSVLDGIDWWVAHKISLLYKDPRPFQGIDSRASEGALRSYFRREVVEQRASRPDTNSTAIVLGDVIPVGFLKKIILPNSIARAKDIYKQKLKDIGAPDVELVFADALHPEKD